MPLIIDGYNLLHASGVVPSHGAGSLERARNALLHFLVNTLTDQERTQTTVVFDAANAPYGLPAVLSHAGMGILFARDQGEADALIEDLIEMENAPRALIVVSSDHRLHRAARRRRATAVDSDVWFRELLRRRQKAKSQPHGAEKPIGHPSAAEVRAWLKTFGFEYVPPSRNPNTAANAAPIEPPPAAQSGELPLSPSEENVQGPLVTDRPAASFIANEGPIPEAAKDAELFPPGFGDGIFEN